MFNVSQPYEPRLVAAVLHSGAIAAMAYGWFGLHSLGVNEWISKQRGGHFQFLTIQGLFVAGFTMALSLVLDFAPAITIIKRLKRTVFMIALPLAVVITTIYWSLLLLCPSLILQKDEPKPSSSSEASTLSRIPLEMDLALHAAPAITLLLDFYLFERRYSTKQAIFGGLLVATIAGIWYASWVEYCASYNGVFPYPFLTFNPFNIRAVIYGSAMSFAYVCFLGLNAAHA